MASRSSPKDSREYLPSPPLPPTVQLHSVAERSMPAVPARGWAQRATVTGNSRTTGGGIEVYGDGRRGALPKVCGPVQMGRVEGGRLCGQGGRGTSAGGTYLAQFPRNSQSCHLLTKRRMACLADWTMTDWQ